MGRAIVGLAKPHRGSIQLEGTELVGMGRRAIRPYRRSLQMVFQNPYGSFNPRLTIGRIIEEPLIVQKIGTRPERRRRVAELLRAGGSEPGRYVAISA